MIHRARPTGASLALLVLLVAAVPAVAQEAVVRGQVRAESGGRPLSGALVELVGAAQSRNAVAGPDGRYLLRGMPAGRQMLRASHIGYAPLEVEVLVPRSGAVELDLSLPLRPVALEPVRVASGRHHPRSDTVPAGAPELSIAGARAIESTPGIAELGLGDTRGVPGQEPPDPSQVLFVRGAAADLKLVFLDGAPVYAPFPLGGLMEAFTPELLGAADVYLGGAPARYDGGLSYVLDLRTRGARRDRPSSSGAVDMLGARALVEVPLGADAGLLAAGRAVHGIGATMPLPYAYQEALVRGDVRLSSRAALTFTGFHNAESVWLDGSGTPDSTITWGNLAASSRLRGSFGDTDVELGAAVGDFRARLPIRGLRPIVADGGVFRTRLSADLSNRLPQLTLRYGAAVDGQAQSYRAQRTVADTLTGEGVSSQGAALVAGVYVDGSWQAAPRVRLRGGLRADHFSLDGRLAFAPRFSGTWLVTDRAALTLAAGRYHQYLRAPEMALLAASTDTVVRAGASPAPLSIGHATHFTAGLDQDLGEGIRLGIEGYFKNFQGLPGVETAAANASGMDFWFRRSEGEITGWLGYSLGWIWSVGAPLQSNSFTGRHLLSSGASMPLGERTRLQVNFAYGAGLPYSTIPLAVDMERGGVRETSSFSPGDLSPGSDSPPLLPAPDRAYLRLDLAASRTWTPTLFGSRVEVGSYFKLLNTLGRRDSLFYRYDRDYDHAPRALAAFPLVPVLGVEWKR